MKVKVLFAAFFTTAILLIPAALSRNAVAQSTEDPTSAPGSVEPRAGTTRAADEPQQTELSRILRDSPSKGEGIGSSTRGVRCMLGMLLAYLVVIAILAAVAVFLVKRVFPRIGVSRPAGRRIRVVETTHLAPRKTVFLLRVGSRKILVGSSRDGLTNLGDVTDALDEPGQTES